MNNNRRKEILFGAAFVVVIVGLMIFAGVTSSGKSTQTAAYVGTQTAAVTTEDHSKGPASAKVSVVEYGDFQCPACGAYQPIVDRLEAEYGDRVIFVFRNFPLPQHQNATISAQAAEAAGLQGKYWEMYDLLYAKQSEWSETPTDSIVAAHFNAYAQSIGLDMKKFAADMKSSAVKDKLQKDMVSASAAQVDHTPTFFINLTQIKNPAGYDDFKSALDIALASSTAQ